MHRASVHQILKTLRSKGTKRNIEGMARFGIRATKVFGVGVTPLRALARQLGRNQQLSLRLWKTGFLEARILAALIGDPRLVSRIQMNRWAKQLDNWAVCDSCCTILFDKTPFAREMAIKWSRRKEEFVKRAGFVIMAGLAVHDKSLEDSAFMKFFPSLRRGSSDPRLYVRKGVNWALRQIGKRNLNLHKKAVALARNLARRETSSARWIASDALRELMNPRVIQRIRARS